MKIIEMAGSRFYQEGDFICPEYLNKGNASQFIRHIATKFCKGGGIDVGGGNWPFPGAEVIDRGEKANALNLPHIPDGSLDYVHSSHMLEHLPQADAQKALILWGSKLKKGGHLFLYLPHVSMEFWRPGGAWVGDGHKWSPEAQTVVAMMWEGRCVEVQRSDWPDAYYSFWICGKKV